MRDNLKLYSQPTCGQCKLIKMLLNQKGVSYEVSEDIEEMKALGIQHTPTLETCDGSLLTGSLIMAYIKGLQ